jgi:alpha-glucosidase (family GH31 glycosyl hydrolase)
VNLRRTWTLDPDRFPLEKIQELVTYLHDHNQSYIMMVDPPVSVNDSTSYNNGLSNDVFLKYTNGSVYVAVMWPGATSWVDWLHPNAQEFWTGQMTSFFDPDTGVNVDGIWIDINDVSRVNVHVKMNSRLITPSSLHNFARIHVMIQSDTAPITVLLQPHRQFVRHGLLYLAFHLTSNLLLLPQLD